MFRRPNTGDAEATVNVQGIGGPAAKQNIRNEGKKALKDVANHSGKAKRKYGDLEQFYIGTFDLRLDADKVKFLKGASRTR